MQLLMIIDNIIVKKLKDCNQAPRNTKYRGHCFYSKPIYTWSDYMKYTFTFIIRIEKKKNF